MKVRALVVGLVMAVALAFAGAASAAATVYVRGAGYGHGIGMSQWGAYGYALHGARYEQILAHYYTGIALATTNPNQIVRVLLGSGSAAFAGATHADDKRVNPSLTYWVRADADGSLVLLNQSGKKIGTFSAPLTATGPGPLSVAGLGSYRGSLEFRPNGSGGVDTVNAVGLDDYVRGVISAEMPADWAPEALQAQAVAARTYAISTDVAGSFYNLYPDTRSQMYKGVAAETPETDAAVAATAGQIVTYDGTPAVTYFFASSGGHTENVEDAWAGASPKPWLRGVPDPYDNVAGNPYHRWGSELSIAGAASKLRRFVKGGLIGIRVTKTGASPRIMQADVVGTAGTTNVTGSQLQSAFGLLSTWASFTTISTVAGQAPSAMSTTWNANSEPVAIAQAERLHGLIAAPALRGRVFPAGKGARATIQAQAGKRWRTSLTIHLGRGGTFSVRLPAPGRYRVVYRGLNGPAVLVP